ncbi:winged helix-turn-helix transcriptional regulator [Agarilytica rhodophyticola]|uniref:winged helix-turn-helix transcriptional regulator n=1 Tax=Agarilytica rhodophyticola TaxID=1737490 RepID=UPI000B342B34|nr:helix-turn-helix domain-containing protein [Agarilytica rhodophyticola]
MRWDDINNQTCSLARSMSIFGDRWTLLILRQIFMRVRRFSDIQQSLGVTKHRLSDRLTRLVESGVIYKELYDKSHQRFEYKLTDKGLDLYPVIITIIQWGDKWEADEDGAPIEYLHKDCGKLSRPKLCCSECGNEVHTKNTIPQLGPGITNKLKRGEFNHTDTKFYSKIFDTNKV